MDPSKSQMEDGQLHNEDELLNEINRNLPAKTCAAHGMMLTYIQNNNKNTNKRFDKLEAKIDPVVAYVTKEKTEEEFWGPWKNRIYGSICTILGGITLLIFAHFL